MNDQPTLNHEQFTITPPKKATILSQMGTPETEVTRDNHPHRIMPVLKTQE
jgi:hypothetical protein